MAGDAIDASLGAALTLSTMAAAGLGNAISDMVGLNAAEKRERESVCVLVHPLCTKVVAFKWFSLKIWDFMRQVGIAAGDTIEGLMLRIGLPSAGLTASQMMTKGPKRVHLGTFIQRSSQFTPFAT